MSACPLGKAATASCASRHDRGDGVAPGNGGCGTRAGWASGAVEAATWAASAAGARGWLGVGARPWASESSGASSTRQTVRGGDEKRDTEMKQARAWRSPDNGRKRCCATARATLFQGCSGWGRRTSGVGDQAMGGLMVSAGGALSNRADAVGSAVPRRRRVQDAAGAASSIAEWQISQAEHAAEW